MALSAVALPSKVAGRGDVARNAVLGDLGRAASDEPLARGRPVDGLVGKAITCEVAGHGRSPLTHVLVDLGQAA